MLFFLYFKKREYEIGGINVQKIQFDNIFIFVLFYYRIFVLYSKTLGFRGQDYGLCQV